MKLFFEFIVSMISVFAFTFFFNAPRRAMLFSGIIGGLSWVIFKLMLPITGSYLFSGFLASLFIGLSSEACAIFYKMPATMFIMPALLPLVPGAGTYYSMYYLINEDAKNAHLAITQTIYLIISLAIGIVIASVITRLVRVYFRSIKKNLKK